LEKLVQLAKVRSFHIPVEMLSLDSVGIRGGQKLFQCIT